MHGKLATAVGLVFAGVIGLSMTADTVRADEAEDEAREIAGVGTTRIGLPDAIAAAEKQVGGKVIEAGLEAEEDRPVFYDLIVKKDEGLANVHVDPATGSVIAIGKTRPGNPKRVLIKDPQIDLGDAIRRTEAAAGAKALEGGIEQKDDAPVYVVEIVKDRKVRIHYVDPMSGQVSSSKD